MMDFVLVGSLLVGALAAAGVMILVNELLPATPALGPALRRLHPDLPAVTSRSVAARRLLRRVPVPLESLALLGYTPGRYFRNLLGAAMFGLAVPVVIGFMLATSGRQLPGPVVAAGLAGSLAVAAFFAVLAHADIQFRARKIRREFRQVVAVYLSLVAMERGSGHGTVESLERAAEVGDGWVIRRIRETLLRARAHHRPPWDELTGLGHEIGVPELSDVGQIMQAAGQSGAQVNRTLLERAESLRDQIRTDALAKAEATTGKLEIPGAVLLFILAAFVIYPITQRVYIGIS
ncbi:type II secretion system F family protein [Natronosporangium hydrolyticum]|uniref:Type II secretion system F family protein n=1 Tax=Natronosporangium hydrolyticum TaxID=2811111 RepID=A0A895YFQ4_9ACTN|nr:type II secretion system F family protein [Natronosporangium hydrolyticum]QSB14925.1 type II secretion system F family protein [Natronosporangium hydrolyticum]